MMFECFYFAKCEAPSFKLVGHMSGNSGVDVIVHFIMVALVCYVSDVFT